MTLTRTLRRPAPPRALATYIRQLRGAVGPSWGAATLYAELERWPEGAHDGLLLDAQVDPSAARALGVVRDGLLWLEGEGWRARIDLGGRRPLPPDEAELPPRFFLKAEASRAALDALAEAVEGERGPQSVCRWLGEGDPRAPLVEAVLERLPPRAARVRLAGSRADLEAWLDEHRTLARPTWGVYQSAEIAALDVEGWPRLARWSLEVEGHLEGLALRRRASVEGRRRLDQIEARLEALDPDGPEARRAERALERALQQELTGAWHYEGPRAASAGGRRMCALRAALLEATRAHDGVIPPSPPAPRPLRLWIWEKRGRPAFDWLEPLIAWLGRRLPGLHRARALWFTEGSFIELVRPRPVGFHWVQIQRVHRPMGFKLSVGASLFMIAPADLEPPAGRAAPGAMAPLAELLPEREAPRWVCLNARDLDACLADLERIFAARVDPFFEAADAILAAHRAEEEPHVDDGVDEPGPVGDPPRPQGARGEA